MDYQKVILPRATREALLRGHPWAFHDGLPRLEVGQLVAGMGEAGDSVAWGLADEGAIRIRALGRGEPPRDFSRWLADRVRGADRLRLRLLTPSTTGFRVINGAGDGLPGVVLDRYAGLAVLRLYSKAWESHLDDLVRTVCRLPWVETVIRRYGVARVDGREGVELLHGGAVPEVVVFEEHGMKLLVRPEHGQKTGMFLDHREHRQLVRGWAAGRTVVNLFAYTGGFSVAAALGGAAHVTTVDIAPAAVDDAKENFRLNGLDPAAHAFEVADVFAFEPRGRPDLIVVDPPSLARGKHADRAARRAYTKLHRRLGPALPRDGLLATASCTARLSFEQWRSAIAEGLRDGGDFSWHWQSAQPADHPVGLAHDEGHYLKFALLAKR